MSISSVFSSVRLGSIERVSECVSCCLDSVSLLDAYVPALVLLVEGDEARHARNVKHAANLFQVLGACPRANTVLEYIDIDMNEIEITHPQRSQGDITTFERCSVEERVRIVFRDVKFWSNSLDNANVGALWSPLLSSELLQDEISCILCLALLRRIEIVPFEELISILVRLPNAAYYVEHLLCCRPDMIHLFVDTLTFIGRKNSVDKGSDDVLQHIIASFERIAGICHRNALIVRSTLIRGRLLPALVLRITLENVHDEIVFLDAMIQSSQRRDQSANLVVRLVNDEAVRWNHTMSRSSSSSRSARNEILSPSGSGTSFFDNIDAIIAPVRARILRDIQGFIESLNNHDISTSKDDRVAIAAGADALRLYCRLALVVSLSFTRSDIDAVLSMAKAIAASPHQSLEEPAKLVVAFLFLCPALFKSSSRSKAVEVLSSLRSCNVASEFLSLLFTFCHSGDRSISQLLHPVLKLPVRLSSSHADSLSELVRTDVMNEATVVAYALSLHSDMRPLLHILKSGMLFRVYQQKQQSHMGHDLLYGRENSLRAWLTQTLKDAHTPIPVLLPSILEQAANLCMAASARSAQLCFSSRSQNQQQRVLPSHLLLALLSGDDDFECACPSRPLRPLSSYAKPVTLILSVYYILQYNAVLSSNSQQPTHGNLAIPLENIYTLPLPALFGHLKKNEHLYEVLAPSMVGQAAIQFPELFTVDTMLFERRLAPSKLDKHTHIPTHEIRNRLCRASDRPLMALFCIEALARMDPQSSCTYADDILNVLLPLLLDDTAIDTRITEAFEILWFSWRSCCFGVELLFRTLVHIVHRSCISIPDIIRDPLILLQCDARVFSCVHLLRIHLHIIEVFWHMSRRWYLQLPAYRMTDDDSSSAAAAAASAAAAEDMLDRDLLPFTQETAMIQLLLEHISAADVCRRCQLVVLSFVQIRFASDPRLLRAVHLQGYVDSLLPSMVKHVPAVAADADLVPELLSRTELSQQIFGVRLLSVLCQQCPTREHAHICTRLIQRLMESEAIDTYSQLLPHIVHELLHFVRAFPELSERFVMLLLRLKNLHIDAEPGDDAQTMDFAALVQQTYMQLVDKVLMRNVV